MLIRNVIRRAFEVESTTSIYSGLLRLNDLVLAQPNNQIRLFVVAPSGRREKVFNQLIRPSFHALADQCEFLSFEMVDDAASRIESLKGGKSLRVSGLLRRVLPIPRPVHLSDWRLIFIGLRSCRDKSVPNSTCHGNARATSRGSRHLARAKKTLMARNRYEQLIERIFLAHYKRGRTQVTFDHEEIPEHRPGGN